MASPKANVIVLDASRSCPIGSDGIRTHPQAQIIDFMLLADQTNRYQTHGQKFTIMFKYNCMYVTSP
jgi:hypothetical protein